MEPQPIFFQDQRITVANSDGVVIRCRVVAKNRDRDVALAKDREIKAGELMVKAIKSAGLDNTDTQVEEVSLLGSTLNYGEDALMLKEETTKAVSPSPSALQKLPIVEEKQHQVSKVVIPEPMFKTEGQTLPAREKINKLTKKMNTVKKGGVLAGLVGLFKTKSSTQSITELGSVVAEMKAKKGKLRVEDNKIIFLPSEVGPYGRKLDNKADQVMSMIIETLRLEVESNNKDNLVVAKRIIQDLGTADWSKAYIQKHPELKKYLDDLLIDIYMNNLSKSSPEELKRAYGNLDALFTRVQTGVHFISIYDVFSAINEQQKVFYHDRSQIDQRTIRFLKEWLADQSNRDLLKNAPGLYQSLNDYFMISKNLTNEDIDILALILKRYAFSEVPGPRQGENTPISNWAEVSAEIKSGKHHKESLFYRQLVKDVANDLSTLCAYYLKIATPGLIEDGTIGTEQARISNWVAKELLTPVVGTDPKKQALNMLEFFLDVQNELAKNNQLDPFFRIKTGLEKAAVSRLGLTSKLPSEYLHLHRSLLDYAKSMMENMGNSDDLLKMTYNLPEHTRATFLPYIDNMHENFTHLAEDQKASKIALHDRYLKLPWELKSQEESTFSAVKKIYDLKILEERGKFQSVLATVQQKYPYNPNLSTTISDELNNELLSETDLFLLSYQFVPN